MLLQLITSVSGAADKDSFLFEIFSGKQCSYCRSRYFWPAAYLHLFISALPSSGGLWSLAGQAICESGTGNSLSQKGMQVIFKVSESYCV